TRFSRDWSSDVCSSDLTEGFYITSTEIFYTSDSGVTWTKKRNIQFGNDINFYGSLGFVVGNAGRVYKSIDSGDTWQQINVGVNRSEERRVGKESRTW